MSRLQRTAEWLNIRPDEVRIVFLSFCGAFLVLSFLILGRALREALYLTTFPVETLPYITAAVAFLSLPSVAVFARLVAGRDPKAVLSRLLVVLAVGIGLLWPVATAVPAAVVAFYLWLALGTLLVTSGFWLITAELFAVRGAKRLFGLIGAGGTLGAMVTGNLLAWFSGRVELSVLIPGLIVLLFLFLGVELLLPAVHVGGETGGATPASKARGGEEGKIASAREGLALVWRTPHLRTVALIVFTATVASTLVDYQFKELASAELDTPESLAGFFGAFYGWTGAAALFVQVAVVARVLTRAGVGPALAVLPSLLLLGSAGLLLAPGLALATAVRGADNSLRKSLHRSSLEVLYVPIEPTLRRKTKTFIDSVVDAVGEGAGAAIVFLWVTLPGFPSRFLSLFVFLLAAGFLYLSRYMGRTYVRTVTEELRVGGEAVAARTDQRDLLSVSFTRIDIRPVLEQSGTATATVDLSAHASRAAAVLAQASERLSAAAEPGTEPRPGAEGAPPADAAAPSVPEATDAPAPRRTAALLATGRESDVRRALAETTDWKPRHVPALSRLLARDSLYPEVVDALVDLEDVALPHLAEVLRDPAVDFSIRRRVPTVLARYDSPGADDALLDGLTAPRFEVRYRSAIALVRRRRAGRPASQQDWRGAVWEAVRREVGRERPVWELQRLLDGTTSLDDGLVAQTVGDRGGLSLEHTFRLLSLVLEPEAVRSAFRGVTHDESRLNSLALEYLEHVLPGDIRDRLWPFIGDLSERQRRRSERPLDQVISDLVTTSATLFRGELQQQDLRRLLVREDDPGEPAQ